MAEPPMGSMTPNASIWMFFHFFQCRSGATILLNSGLCCFVITNDYTILFSQCCFFNSSCERQLLCFVVELWIVFFFEHETLNICFGNLKCGGGGRAEH